MISLYRLDQIQADSGNRAELGKLPKGAVALLAALGSAWVLIGIYVLCDRLKAKNVKKNH